MGSQVVGNIISAFVLGEANGGQVQFSFIMIGSTILSTIMFILLKRP